MRVFSCFFHVALVYYCFQSSFAEYINVLKDSDVCLMITSKKNDKVDTCSITLPDGSSYVVFPNSSLPLYIQDVTKASSASCAVKLLSVSVGRKGPYVLTVNSTEGEQQNKTFLRVQESAKLWPTSLDTVYQGEDFFMKMIVNVTDLTECHVVYPVGSNSMDVIVSKGENPFPEGQCGIRVSNVHVTNSGFWKLYTVDSAQNSYVAEKRIKIYGNDGVFIQKSLQLGSENAIAIYSSDLQSDITYCFSKSMDGTLSELQYGGCSLPKSTITDNDAKNYSFKLGLKGKVEEVEATLQVSVHPAEVSSEYKPIETSVSTAASGSINMLCRLWSTDKITDDEDNKVSLCRFVRPDGTGVQVSEGVANKNYGYFGDGMNTQLYKDCGLTIYSPKDGDYGTWKCYLYWKSKLRLGELEVGDKTGEASRPEGAVVSGSGGVVLALGAVNQELRCRADRGLDYCWFLAPDGSHVVPAVDRQDLAAGLCRHGLGPVGPEHGGQWACNMGVAGRRAGDLVHRISVRVSNSTLLAEASEVTADAGGTAILSCTTVPAGKTLGYCRFVSPTGRGFSFSEANRNETIMDRYQQSDGPLGQYRGIRVGVCSVTITAVHAEDYGKWRCSGIIQGTFAEGSDFINLSQEENAVNGISMAAIVGAAVGSAAVIAVVVAFMWWVVKKKERSNGHRNLSDSGSEHSSEVQLQMGEILSLPSRFAAGTRQVSFRHRRSVHS